MKTALIFGVTGQDGSYLAEFLLKKKYKVHGVKRKSSSYNTNRIDHILETNKNFSLHYGDVTDAILVMNIISRIRPDEIYNLSAQSHVAVSFEIPEYTANVDALGCLRILEAIKSSNLTKKCKFYQAGTSEMYGKVHEIPQNEKTKFQPTSPYSISKLYAYWITKYYRDAYNIFACNGILFNHESPRRGETFVTRKITIGLAKIINGQNKFLEVGNLNSLRDWGHAKEYAEMQWLMLQNKKPNDFVISTGESHTVKEFVEESFKYIGIEIRWKGKGLREIGYNKKNGQVHVRIDPGYFRPTDIKELRGDYSKAKRVLKWKPKTKFKKLVEIMMASDIKNIKN